MNTIKEKRHSLAHLLAAAIEGLYPQAKITLGPDVANGFYYDVDFEKEKFKDEDLKELEKKMKKISNSWSSFEEKELSYNEAKKMFAKNEYKMELIEEIHKKGEKITVYQSGNFTDLCRGGHIENMDKIKNGSWKLDRLAGAYWRGDEKNKMLTRIYGLAFDDKKELLDYEKKMLEAAKRDHRKLGKELDLFTFSELVGPGLPLFTPKGTLIRKIVRDKVEDMQSRLGWEKVTTPHITKKELYETSGHWEKFGDELFRVTGKGESEFVMKPMNCPHHTQIYASKPHSYRDLPVRFSENGVVYRDEQAGELLGLSRVRHITQDDGHCFCTKEQVEKEVSGVVSIIKDFYTDVGMYIEGNFWVSLSVHDPEDLEKYMIYDDGLFIEAEKILEDIAKKEKLPYRKMVGEAAFYGPKLDFQFTDSIGREWQLGTVQLDFSMPKRFALEYTDKDGSKKTPVMIHRAIAGSLERFMSILIEHFAGAFPFWLSPVQVKIIPVAKAHNSYAKEVFEKLKEAKIRVEIDSSDNSLGKKVREAKKEKIPYYAIVGDKDIKAKKITLESRDSEKSEQLSLKKALEKFNSEMK